MTYTERDTRKALQRLIRREIRKADINELVRVACLLDDRPADVILAEIEAEAAEWQAMTP
jgi:hypothetical protein